MTARGAAPVKADGEKDVQAIAAAANETIGFRFMEISAS
jgi:hypothetical protein